MFGPCQEIAKTLVNEDDFLVVSHESPDGDAMGSTVAMGWILQSLGKQYMLYNPSGLPDHFTWLNTPANIEQKIEEVQHFAPGRVIVLDCGDPFRMGKELLKVVDPKTIINMDHHVGNPMFGSVNWVDINMAAVGEMVAMVAKELGIPLAGGLGEAIYLAVVSDTGNFSYGNTKPETLKLAAEIMRRGLNIAEFSSKYQNQWKIGRIRLWSEAMRDAELHVDEKVIVVQVTRDLLARHGTTSEDCEGLVEFMRRVRTVRVAISMREERDNLIKFSLRSQGADNVQKVAKRFGGGGHKNAAGGMVPETMEVAKQQLIKAIQEEMAL